MRGQARRSNGVVVHWTANGREGNRYGLVAKSTLGGAVVRNRVRRWMRALLQAWATGLAAGYDLIIVARDVDAGRSFADFQTHLSSALVKAELLEVRSAG